MRAGGRLRTLQGTAVCQFLAQPDLPARPGNRFSRLLNVSLCNRSADSVSGCIATMLLLLAGLSLIATALIARGP